MSLWTIDFETHPIDAARPHVVPVPVGVAIRRPSGRSTYLAWGHPTGNNASRATAHAALRMAWASGASLLFHHAQFDLSVAAREFSLPWPDADRIEDTRLLAFLADSYRERLSLDELAQDWLGMPPKAEECAELHVWIREHVPGAWRKSDRKLAEFFAQAPGNLVARRAKGDVERTFRLWKHLAAVRRAFPDAYRLEVRTLAVAQVLTARGIPVDVPALEAFAKAAPRRLAAQERILRARLGVPRGTDLAGDVGRDAIVAAIRERGWGKNLILTGKKGVPSLAADDLEISLVRGGKPARRFLDAWRAYKLLAWQLSSIATPWLARAQSGRVHVSWDTTRNAERGRLMGARTGRLSSTPNLQNVGKRGDLTPRTWVRAPHGRRLVGRDVKSQEPRIMAHFAGGRMLEGYLADPDYDPHGDVARDMGIDREPGKIMMLATPYGRGADAIARSLAKEWRREVTKNEAWDLKRRFWQARPELLKLTEELRVAWATGQSLVTWARAEIRVEATPEDPGRYAYRALQILTQRSAAEQLKVAICTAHEAGVELVLPVHDELVAECGVREAKEVNEKLRDAMENTGKFHPWRVPFRSDGKIGRTWKELK